MRTPAVAALTEAMRQDADAVVRRSAAEALGELCEALAQQHLPKDANIFVACEASRTCGRSRPSRLSLAQAFIGICGFYAPTSTKQSQHVMTMRCSSSI